MAQQPLQIKLQVFKTEKKGWGIRCLNDIPQGGFICIYAGRLLTEQGANEVITKYVIIVSTLEEKPRNVHQILMKERNMWHQPEKTVAFIQLELSVDRQYTGLKLKCSTFIYIISSAMQKSFSDCCSTFFSVFNPFNFM